MTQRLMFWAGLPLMALAAMLAVSGVSFGVGSGGTVVGTWVGDTQQYLAAFTMFAIGLVLTSSATLLSRRKMGHKIGAAVPAGLLGALAPSRSPELTPDRALMALALPTRSSPVQPATVRGAADAGGLSSLQRPSMTRPAAPGLSADAMFARILDVENENERIRVQLQHAKATVSR
jgi:hypothetical protein